MASVKQASPFSVLRWPSPVIWKKGGLGAHGNNLLTSTLHGWTESYGRDMCSLEILPSSLHSRGQNMISAQNQRQITTTPVLAVVLCALNNNLSETHIKHNCSAVLKPSLSSLIREVCKCNQFVYKFQQRIVITNPEEKRSPKQGDSICGWQQFRKRFQISVLSWSNRNIAAKGQRVISCGKYPYRRQDCFALWILRIIHILAN